jgi:transposase
MARPIRALILTAQQLSQLSSAIKRRSAPQRMARRWRIILLRSQGISQEQVALTVGVNRPVVVHWEKRFRDQGMVGLDEGRRSGRKPSISDEVRAAIISEATRPPAGHTQWSTRKMAKAKDVSNQTVQKLWKANGIKPHITRTFKVSNDKQFERKFWDVIGLYLNPPERALVLCCDEKSQCQALERTQPGLPLGIGHVRTATHDYIRHGTVTLFAALNYLDGKIFHQTAARHTHREWLAFLKKLDQETPEGLALHLIIDNYSTHKHEKVRSWIKWRNQRHRKAEGEDRLVLHFTPTSSSWMNLVERFFRDLTVDCVRDGSFGSVKELVASMELYLAGRNLEPVRYEWKAEGAAILEKIERARAAREITKVSNV